MNAPLARFESYVLSQTPEGFVLATQPGWLSTAPLVLGLLVVLGAWALRAQGSGRAFLPLVLVGAAFVSVGLYARFDQRRLVIQPDAVRYEGLLSRTHELDRGALARVTVRYEKKTVGKLRDRKPGDSWRVTLEDRDGGTFPAFLRLHQRERAEALAAELGRRLGVPVTTP